MTHAICCIQKGTNILKNTKEQRNKLHVVKQQTTITSRGVISLVTKVGKLTVKDSNTCLRKSA